MILAQGQQTSWIMDSCFKEYYQSWHWHIVHVDVTLVKVQKDIGSSTIIVRNVVKVSMTLAQRNVKVKKNTWVIDNPCKEYDHPGSARVSKNTLWIGKSSCRGIQRSCPAACADMIMAQVSDEPLNYRLLPITLHNILYILYAINFPTSLSVYRHNCGKTKMFLKDNLYWGGSEGRYSGGRGKICVSQICNFICLTKNNSNSFRL